MLTDDLAVGCWGPCYTMSSHAALGVVRSGVAVLKGRPLNPLCTVISSTSSVSPGPRHSRQYFLPSLQSKNDTSTRGSVQIAGMDFHWTMLNPSIRGFSAAHGK